MGVRACVLLLPARVPRQTKKDSTATKNSDFMNDAIVIGAIRLKTNNSHNNSWRNGKGKAT